MSTNRFPATCTKCRRRIDAGKGTHNGKVGNRHTYVCTGICDGSLDTAPRVTERVADIRIAGLRYPVSTFLYERISRMVRENRDHVESAWQQYREENEYFDGEIEIEQGARRTFFAVAEAYLNHPDIVEAREFSRYEAEQEMEAYR